MNTTMQMKIQLEPNLEAQIGTNVKVKGEREGKLLEYNKETGIATVEVDYTVYWHVIAGIEINPDNTLKK